MRRPGGLRFRTGGGSTSEPVVDVQQTGADATHARSSAVAELSPAEEAARAEHVRLAAGALIRADGLVAGHVPGVDVLHGIDLHLQDGELIGIVGPNGAGRSTLLKALFGLIPVRSGQVTLRGEDVTGAPAHRLVSMGVGYVPQRDGVFPSLTVEENMRVGAHLRPKTAEDRFDHVVELFPLLGERRRRRAGSLSAGERQMVAMGRALMTAPSVLLLDEPSAGLSPAHQDELFIRCRRIHATGVSIIMVEQNARRCLQICDRGYVLAQGRTAFTGTGQSLLEHPQLTGLPFGRLAGAR